MVSTKLSSDFFSFSAQKSAEEEEQTKDRRGYGQEKTFYV
jgi:hypothetical protein